MNAVLWMILIVGGSVGVTMLLRKSNAVATWLADYWAGRQRLPEDFELHGDGCVFLVDYGQVPPRQMPGMLRIITAPEAEVFAVRDSVVSFVGTIPSLGRAVGLSSLFTDNESVMYIGLSPMVGLGQIVYGDFVIGSMLDQSELIFQVYGARIPNWEDASIPRLDAAAWLRRRGTAVSPQEV